MRISVACVWAVAVWRGRFDSCRAAARSASPWSAVCLAVLLSFAGCTVYNQPVRGVSADSHRVQRGDTLYSIAWKNGLDYRTVARWNGIRPPYTIYVGQHIRLSAPDSARARADSAPQFPASRTPPPVAGGRTLPVPAPRAEASDAAMPNWQWPAGGPVLRRFDADANGKKGITLGGTHGTQVRAAAAGQVVYAGSGLVGYGRLIIIKHNDVYLSAYGHNRHLLVNEGDAVRSGQVIAEMGSSGTNRIQLHFEIRRKGKPVDPLRYLPRRQAGGT